tara:strand:- start:186 stop:416 length:231 start_codon:yes stop_codon:yes gene_type:complete
MTTSKSTQIVPLFDPKKEEKVEKNQHNVELFPIDLKSVSKSGLKTSSRSRSSNGSWAPQDACGGHQWNAAIDKWVI